MLAIGLGLGSSLCWGLADFLGGLKSRTLPVLGVMLVSQLVGLGVIVAVVGVRAAALPDAGSLLLSALAGALGILGLASFYRALAVGTMSIVAPISAAGAALPVLVGIAGGDRPSALQVVGMATAVVGVVLAAREGVDEHGERRGSRLGLALAFAAALGFGGYFAAMGRAAAADPYWAQLCSRAVGVGLLAACVVALRVPVGIRAPDLRHLVGLGLFDVTGTTAYAVATTKGLLSVVGVLGSLYPVTTILLARAVLGERIGRTQQLGVGAVVAGVALLAAG